MRRLLWFALLLCACSKGQEADLPSIAAARSLGAEWALVNEQAKHGHLTGAYVKTMRKQLREQLLSNRTSLTESNSSYGREIEELLQQPPDASPAVLRAHVAKLKQIESKLESA